ncbi:hypothetical protein QJS65_10615 [Bacillus altitudinis]|uniref:hypothetical protein n=1 Tax=Bacillus TaxID=1386 RepID=UPI0024A9BA08|nr:hypothetical protein [Bacillus altitudinis]WHF25301.1 hypothetical protein QJS65_10615 [Bacillus altitudinis]
MKNTYIETVFSKNETLYSEKVYKYLIGHTYDLDPQKDVVVLKTTISPEKFELLLAHLLFKAVEISGIEEVELYQNEIQKILVEKYTDKDIGKKYKNTSGRNVAYKMDLYQVWEKWCSDPTYRQILNIDEFNVEGLEEIIFDILLKREDEETRFIIRNVKAVHYLEKAADQFRYTDVDDYKFDVVDVVWRIEDIKKIIKGDGSVSN